MYAPKHMLPARKLVRLRAISVAVGLLATLLAPFMTSVSVSGASTTRQYWQAVLGYWLVNPDGRVLPVWGAMYYGSVTHMPKGSHAVSIAPMPNSGGYWVATDRGQIFAFGKAKDYGGLAGPHPVAKPGAPIISMAAAPDGRGYWLADSKGQVYAFGDAHFYGPRKVSGHWPTVRAIVADPAGGGYWLLTTAGRVLGFGGAHLYGNGARSPIPGATAMAATPNGKGYWLTDANGRVYAFGDARDYGSAPAGAVGRVVGLVPTPGGAGYWIIGNDCAVWAVGDVWGGNVSPGHWLIGHFKVVGGAEASWVPPEDVDPSTTRALPASIGLATDLTGLGPAFPSTSATTTSTTTGPTTTTARHAPATTTSPLAPATTAPPATSQPTATSSTSTTSLTAPITTSTSTTSTTVPTTTTTVYSPVKMGTKYLPEAMQGTPYSFTLTATAGTTPYTWSVPSGSSMPAGLTVDATTGAITGTPTSPGTTLLTVEVTDSKAPTPTSATAQLSLTVQPHPPVITSLTPTSGSASGNRYIYIYGDYLWQGSSSCLWYKGSGCAGLTVYVGPSKAFVTYSSPGVALVLSPPGSAGTVNVRVDLNGLTSAITTADLYTYT